MPTPARTSLGAIVAEARTLLEAEGLDGLTMQAVAGAVGVRAPSLYKHVSGRGDLVRLVAEDVTRQLAGVVRGAVGSGDASVDLRALAHAFRTFAHQNPQGYALIFAAVPDEWRAAPEALASANDALLRTAGELAGPDRALQAARMVVAWAHGFVSMELAGAFRLGGDVDDAFAFGVDRLASALAIRREAPG
jgi:AcrR family transcriptional regulator